MHVKEAYTRICSVLVSGYLQSVHSEGCPEKTKLLWPSCQHGEKELGQRSIAPLKRYIAKKVAHKSGVVFW